MEFNGIYTRWCPSEANRVQLNITPIKPMVYGRYNELVHGVNLNQLTSLGGTILYGLISSLKIVIEIVSFPIKNCDVPPSLGCVPGLGMMN